jgi:hypothetical protein
MLFPVISQFAAEHGYRMVLGEYQNYYPDISFIAPDETKIVNWKGAVPWTRPLTL